MRNVPHAFEVIHRNRSVCLIDGVPYNTPAFHCHSIDDFAVEWQLPTPEIFEDLKSNIYKFLEGVILFIFAEYQQVLTRFGWTGHPEIGTFSILNLALYSCVATK